jgi:predicted double-glycine peptidase
MRKFGGHIAARMRGRGPFMALLFVSSCATAGFERLDMGGFEPARGGVRLKVPHISQDDNYSCGTTSVAMAISYHEQRFDNPLDKEESWRISKSDIAFARTRGFSLTGFRNLVSAYGYEGRFVNRLGLERLKILLSNGIPVVLFMQPDKGSRNTHAVLAVGYVDATGSLLIEDPANAKRAYGYGELDDFWKAWIGEPGMKTERAGYIVLPKNRGRGMDDADDF